MKSVGDDNVVDVGWLVVLEFGILLRSEELCDEVELWAEDRAQKLFVVRR